MRMTLDSEYCLKSSTPILGVAGEANARTMVFNGLEVDGANTYEVKFGFPDKTSFTATITDNAYLISSAVCEQVGDVQVQIIARNGSTMIRKSNIIYMKVVEAIDYEPPVPTGGTIQITRFTALQSGTTGSISGLPTYD